MATHGMGGLHKIKWNRDIIPTYSICYLLGENAKLILTASYMMQTGIWMAY